MHNSYHDVVVAANNRLYEIFNLPFSVRLMCSRVGGWELWNTGDNEKKIAEEYGFAPFALYVKHDDKKLKPTQFCHHNWTKPQKDWTLATSKEIMIGNQTADAQYLGRGNLEITGSADLLQLLKDYIVFTESVFYDGYLWDVQTYMHDDKLLLQIANPKYNKDI